MSGTVSAKDALVRLKDFVVAQALPLWSTAGFDEAAGCFQERLDFSGAPLTGVPRRLMVQARQIVVYSRASLSGWNSEGSKLALRAFENACRRYRSVDRGWIFSVDANGRPVDATHDLYCYAFVVYMLAWVHRLGDPSSLSLADDTLADIERVFATNGPGFASKVPGPSGLREQNPHMHLFEALLELADASGNERYLHRADALVALFDRFLADSLTGTVREVFDRDWKPASPAGENPVEPGHQMEWAWLLRKWERLKGVSAGERVARLTAHAIRYGVDGPKRLVRSVVQENGRIVSNNWRVWPQTETIRALCREDADSSRWPGLIANITGGLFDNHLPAHLNGGWIDLVGPDGAPAVDYMPASSLYHIVGAAIDGAELLAGQTRMPIS